MSVQYYLIEIGGTPFSLFHEQVLLNPPGEVHPVNNRLRKINFVLSGELRHRVIGWNGAWGDVVLRAGDALTLPHHCRQEYSAPTPDSLARLHVIRLAFRADVLPPLPLSHRPKPVGDPPEDDLTALADACLQEIHLIRLGQDAEFQETMGALREEARRRLPGYRLRMHGLCASLLVLLSRHILVARRTDAAAPAAIFHVRQAKDYLRHTLGQPVLVADLARHVGITEEHLSRLFRQQTGLTVVEYLRRLRIERARNYLTTTEKNLSEIARQVGFSSLTVFTRNFRQETGMTPSEFRRQIAGQIG